MIYLQSEEVVFDQVKAAFAHRYTQLLQKMLDTFEKKGETRDTGSPIHHRQSPYSMLGVAQSKGRRIESILSRPGWEKDRNLLEGVIEECVDIANYVTYVAALCVLLLEEEQK